MKFGECISFYEKSQMFCNKRKKNDFSFKLGTFWKERIFWKEMKLLFRVFICLDCRHFWNVTILL